MPYSKAKLALSIVANRWRSALTCRVSPLHYGIYPILEKHGGQRIKVGRRVIQMLFPMIQNGEQRQAERLPNFRQCF